MGFHKKIEGKMVTKWSFSYDSFVKLSLHNMIHFPMDLKHSIIKGLYCTFITDAKTMNQNKTAPKGPFY